MKSKLLHKLILIFFLSVPVISSFVSTIHIVDFFYLGNYKWIAILLAISFEFGAIASFIALSILQKINKYIIIFIFIILFLMQLIGNVYFSYDLVSQKLLSDPTWLKNFNELIRYLFIMEDDIIFSKIILSILIGVPIPLISISFLKSLVDYLNPIDDTISENNIIKKVENIKEEGEKKDIIEDDKEVIDVKPLVKEPPKEKKDVIEDNKEPINIKPLVKENIKQQKEDILNINNTNSKKDIYYINNLKNK